MSLEAKLEEAGRLSNSEAKRVLEDLKTQMIEIYETIYDFRKKTIYGPYIRRQIDLIIKEEQEIKPPNVYTFFQHLSQYYYTLADVIKNPWKSSLEGIWTEFQTDVDYFDLLPFKNKKLRLLAVNGGMFFSFGVSAIPHELMHGGMNLLTGGTNKEIVFNTLYGGSLLEKIIPGVKSEWMIPFLGGYVQPEYSSFGGSLATMLVPYVMTPLGLYLLAKGKENKAVSLCVAGSGIVAAHIGGIFGDFFTFGRTLVSQGLEALSNAVNFENSSENYLLSSLTLLGGFYVGLKTARYTYRLSRGLVNSVLSDNSKKEENPIKVLGRNYAPRMRINLL